MKLWGLCSAALALALVSAPALAGVAEGNAAWLAGKYDEAIAQWRPAADAGSPEAQFNLGQAYKLGRGVQMNMKEAETWYRKSAVQGFTDAQDMLGLMLFRQGDRQEAMPWIEKSAARGEPRAMYVLGTAKFNGDYTAKDWPGAYALMTRASQAGLDQAKTSLQQMDRFLSAADKSAGLALAQRQGPATPPRSAEADTRTAQAAAPGSAPAYVPINPGAAPTPTPTPAPVQMAQATPTYPAPQPTYPASPQGYAPPPAQPTAEVDGQTVVVPGAEVNVPVPSAPAAPAYTPPPAPTPTYSAPVQTAPASAPRPARPPRAVATAAVSGGPWKIQLGAFATPGAPQEAWRNLSSRIAVLRGLRFNTQAAGRVVRLQPVGLASRAEATRVCRIVIAAGNACIPVAP